MTRPVFRRTSLSLGRWRLIHSIVLLAAVWSVSAAIPIGAQETGSRIPQRVIECEVLDVMILDLTTGRMVEHPNKTIYTKRPFLLDTRTGRIMSKAGIFDTKDRAPVIVDDGQSTGQWLKITYSEKLPSLRHTKGSLATLMVERGVFDRRLLFRMMDEVNVYSGTCQ